MKGNTEYLTYGIELFHIQSQTNKNIVEELNENIKFEAVRSYVEYLSLNTEDEQAYQYSNILRSFDNNFFLRDAIYGNIDALYNEKSFPIQNVTEKKYRTSYNIMHVLYRDDKDKFLAYCNDVKKECDNMAAHRIEILIKEITEEK